MPMYVKTHLHTTPVWCVCSGLQVAGFNSAAELCALTNAELQGALRVRKLTVGGKKLELQARLAKALGL